MSPAAPKYVSYVRVSTDKQEASGLGLDAQRKAVADFLNRAGGKHVAEYCETESGRNRGRPELHKALQACKLHRATLIVAKLDRLARDVGFLSWLRDEQVEFVACDMPGANQFCVTVMIALAEQERELISRRTREALQAAKARGVRLGGRPENLSAEGRARGIANSLAVREAKARERAELYRPTLEEIGARPLRQIAAELTARGIPTPSKEHNGTWSAAQVSRVLSYLRAEV